VLNDFFAQSSVSLLEIDEVLDEMQGKAYHGWLPQPRGGASFMASSREDLSQGEALGFSRSLWTQEWRA
jgi:hypothetical protein